MRLQVRCEGGEEFPADLLLLGTSKDNGMCYVETSNLDGETSLKIRKARTDPEPRRPRRFQHLLPSLCANRLRDARAHTQQRTC